MLGVFDSQGRLGYITPSARVGPAFVESVTQTGTVPERRFRFAGACVEHHCKQWTGARCGVIEKVLRAVPTSEASEGLPACSIRSSCRWFAQAGRQACGVCPLVTTDST